MTQASKTLPEISAEIRKIDFCMLVTRAQDGSLAGRPMSNNQEVAYEGTSYFFSYDDTRTIEDIASDASTGMTYRTLAGPDGAPGMFIHVEGEAEIVKDKARFADHWEKSLDRWFPEGTDTDGLVMLEIPAKRIHYWDGEDEGEVDLSSNNG